jgi:hypothetical protein
MYFPDDQFALFKFRTKMRLAASVRDGVAESAKRQLRDEIWRSASLWLYF